MNEGLEPRCNVASATTRRPGTDFYLFSVVNLRIKEKGVFLMEKKSATSRLVIMAFLIAMEIILTRFCSINTPILRIGFGFLPVAMMLSLIHIYPSVSPLRSNDFRWYWNLNQLSIAYDSRPWLRPRPVSYTHLYIGMLRQAFT